MRVRCASSPEIANSSSLDSLIAMFFSHILIFWVLLLKDSSMIDRWPRRSCHEGREALHLMYPHAKVASIEDEMHFDPLITMRHIQPTDVAAYSNHLGRKLSIIGEAARGYLILMMDEAGHVYALYDNYFGVVGNSGIDAIEALCSGREIENSSLLDGWDQPA
jgi:hypothetical protein